MSKIIGIDLGTTNSCAAVMEGGMPVVIANAEGMRITPSVVALTKANEMLVGGKAKQQSITNPQNTIVSIKRKMGSREKTPLGEENYLPQEISAMILRKLKSDAEAYLGEPVTEAVITVPAYFTDDQRQATIDAGRIAGLSVKRVISESSAAALAYCFDKEQAQKILVFALGGGMLDVSVIDYDSGVVEILAVSGNIALGGDDFDVRVIDYLASEFRKTEDIDLKQDKVAMLRLKEAAESAKKELSGVTTANINLPYIVFGKDGPKNLDITLTRNKFDELTADLVEKAVEPIRLVIEDVRLSIEEGLLARGDANYVQGGAYFTVKDVNKVILAGGATRIPAIQTAIQKIMGNEPFKGINPDECVAVGASIQGGKLAGDPGARDVLLLDVTSLSLGIETMGGVATKLIDKNTTIPTKKKQIFSTAADNQVAVDIVVLQGEKQLAQDNKTIGTFQLGGIPPAPRGVPQIEVTYDIDSNGIVYVSAKDLGSGKEQKVTITASNKMSDEEIITATGRMSVGEIKAEIDRNLDENLGTIFNNTTMFTAGTKRQNGLGGIKSETGTALFKTEKKCIERVIGIDFGTSTSVVKVKTYKDGVPMDAAELADYVRFDGKDTAPTLIYLHKNGDVLAEYSAENAADSGMGELCANFKLDLINPDEEARKRAFDLTKLFFKHIYKVYEDQKTLFPKCDVETTYISYPAKWPEELIETMLDIAEEAGFQNVDGLDEPTAAVHTVLVQQLDNLKELGLVMNGKTVNVLMVDMGAGTTDLVLCRYTPGADKSVEILNIWPKSDSDVLFGGREIDGLLCDYVKNYLVRCGMPEKKDYRKMFLVNSKRWKEANVSAELKKKDGIVRICGFINPFMNMLDSDEEFPPIDRTVFETMTKKYIKQFPRLINDCIADTQGVAPEDVDLVILTGGHSQWYFANEMLEGSLVSFGLVNIPKIKLEPNRIIRLPRPHETVALGLVYQPLNVRPTPKPSDDDGPVRPEPAVVNTNEDAVYKRLSKAFQTDTVLSVMFAGQAQADLQNDADGFLLLVDSVYTVIGKGTVVTGIVEYGAVKLNDIVELYDANMKERYIHYDAGVEELRNAVITGIEMSGVLIDSARTGDIIGLLLRGVVSDEVQTGYRLIKRRKNTVPSGTLKSGTITAKQKNLSDLTPKTNESKWKKINSQDEAAAYATHLKETMGLENFTDSEKLANVNMSEPQKNSEFDKKLKEFKNFADPKSLMPVSPLDSPLNAEFNKRLKSALTYAKISDNEYTIYLYDLGITAGRVIGNWAGTAVIPILGLAAVTTTQNLQKTGFIATTKGIHCQIMIKKDFISWKEISSISLEKNDRIAVQTLTSNKILVPAHNSKVKEQLALLNQIWQDLR